MSRKSNRYDRAAHIKRHTEGTSNEISFDVLDAARAELEGGAKKVRKSSGIMPGVRVPSLNFGLGTRKVSSDEGGASSTPETFTPTRETPAETTSRPSHKRKTERARKRADARAAKASAPMATPAPAPAPVMRKARTPEETELEIERRKARRRRHRRRVRFLVVVIIIVAALAGAATLYAYIQAEQNKTARINAFIESLTEVDETLVQVDSAITDPIASVTTGVWKTLKPDLENQQTALQNCMTDARAMSNELLDQSSKELLGEIETCAKERLSMLTAAQSIFKEAESAQKALDAANSAWLILVDADNLAREASSVLSGAVADSTLDDTVKESMEKSEQALTRFNEAAIELAEVEQSFDGVDLQVYIDYAYARAEAMEEAIASDQALLDRDSAAATEHNDAYNAADEKAVSLAASFPSAISAPIKEAFEKDQETVMAAYDSARERASAADAFIRDYLGTSNK